MEKKKAGPGYFVGILEVTRKSKPDRHGKLRKVKINIYSGFIYLCIQILTYQNSCSNLQ